MNVEPPQQTAAQLWRRHTRRPLQALFIVALLFATTRIDVSVASAAFFDAAHTQWASWESWG